MGLVGFEFPSVQVVGREVLRLDEHGPQCVCQDLAAAPHGLEHRPAHVLPLVRDRVRVRVRVRAGVRVRVKP